MQTESNRFIQNVKYYIEHFGAENTYNSDRSIQFALQLKFHTGRCLAIQSSKKIKSNSEFKRLYCAVQSTLATT